MKKVIRDSKERDIEPEYDFSNGVRGKYAKRFARGTNVVVLDPDVAAVFLDSRCVNTVLRTVANLGRRSRGARK